MYKAQLRKKFVVILVQTLHPPTATKETQETRLILNTLLRRRRERIMAVDHQVILSPIKGTRVIVTDLLSKLKLKDISVKTMDPSNKFQEIMTDKDRGLL